MNHHYNNGFSSTLDSGDPLRTSTDCSESEAAIFPVIEPPAPPAIGIGLDSCLIPLKHADLFLVQSTDFFYPLVDDPYMMGRIACANVLSDLYAMGVVDVDNILMILATSQRFSAEESHVVMSLMIRGFNDCAKEAGTSVNGGQSVINPWVTIGGTATSVVKANELILPDNAQPGDVLILTKPLGTQLAVNAHQWLWTHPGKIETLKSVVIADEIKASYDQATRSMARLNRTGARLMHKYGAHAATDVTGFGILGHAENLASCQKSAVDFEIDTLPILKNIAAIAKIHEGFGLLQGISAETSGGLLIALPEAQADLFCHELLRIEGVPAWKIGRVVPGNRSAKIVPDPVVIEVSDS